MAAKLRNPMEELIRPLHATKRCGAHARTTGKPCRRWATTGFARCRMHGGVKGSGRPSIHGRRSAQAQRNNDFVRVAKLLLRTLHKKPTAT